MIAPTFRDAEPGDIDMLLAMMRQLFEHDDFPFHEETSRRAALLLMREPSAGRLLVIEADGAAAGYVVLTFGFSLEYGGWHGFIDELFVAEPFRGKGLGSATIDYMRGLCASRGMTAILLEADLKNADATRLYRRLGFSENPRRLMLAHIQTDPEVRRKQ